MAVSCAVCAVCFFLFFRFPYYLQIIVSLFTQQVREARIIFRQAWERLGYARKMDEEQLSS